MEDIRVLDTQHLDIKNGKLILPPYWMDRLGYPRTAKVKARLFAHGIDIIGLVWLCPDCGVPLIFGEHDEINPYICAACNRKKQGSDNQQ